MNHTTSITNPGNSSLPESVLIEICASHSGIPTNFQLQEAVLSTTTKIYETINRHHCNGSKFVIRFKDYFVQSITWKESKRVTMSECIDPPFKIPENNNCKSSYRELLLRALKALGFTQKKKSKNIYILQ